MALLDLVADPVQEVGGFLGPGGRQSEKFMLPRPSLTCPITFQDTGATFEYHGHTVSVRMAVAA